MTNRKLEKAMDRRASVATQTAPDVAKAVRDRPAVRQSDTEPSQVPVSMVRPSPFQPVGRPSSAAIERVQRAIQAAGSLTLLSDKTETELTDLVGPKDSEARQLADLAADVALNGIDQPLEIRRVAGGVELLSGHRRLAAAKLAGREQVSVIDRGEIADHEAAAIVFRRNRLRADFTAWQEAASLKRLADQRQEAGLPASAREMGRLLGYSHTKAAELFNMANAFSPGVLKKIDRNTARAEERLSNFSYRQLRALSQMEDESVRIAETAPESSGNGSRPDDRASVRQPDVPFSYEERKRGGFVLTLNKPVGSLTARQARDLAAKLDEIRRSVRKVEALRRPNSSPK